MKIVSRRADVSSACYWVARADGTRVPEHFVEPDARGFFVVTSARSGERYRVSASDGRCRRESGEACPGFAGRGTCSHLAAVVRFAARVLEGRK